MRSAYLSLRLGTHLTIVNECAYTIIDERIVTITAKRGFISIELINIVIVEPVRIITNRTTIVIANESIRTITNGITIIVAIEA